MIILVFLLMTFSPVVIEAITSWIRKGYEKSLDKDRRETWELLENFLKESEIKRENPAMQDKIVHCRIFCICPTLPVFSQRAEIQAYVL